jgi:hypothetical protein
MDYFTDMFYQLKRYHKRRMLQQSVNFGLVVCSALMIWKSLMIIVSDSESLAATD